MKILNVVLAAAVGLVAAWLFIQVLNANDLRTERQALCTWTPASLRNAAKLAHVLLPDQPALG